MHAKIRRTRRTLERRRVLAGHREERRRAIRRSICWPRWTTGRTRSATSCRPTRISRFISPIFARTFVIGAAVTFFALLLGYPLAYWISTLSARRANLVMILVLIPFWTSILVRVAAWIVMLQSEGLVNKALIGSGLLHRSPLALLFNRTGVVHLDDAHSAAVHDPAAVQRDEVDPADLSARRGLARQPSVRRVLARVCAADLSGHRRRRAAGVHSGDRLLHHAGACSADRTIRWSATTSRTSPT